MPSTIAPSDPQRAAIEAPAQPVLVVAGPGAGKTYCLIERVRHLIQQDVDPRRICAVTFTNKAAEEIAVRLKDTIGPAAEDVTRGTLHSLCLGFLREHYAGLGLPQGFGVADEVYQKLVLRRLRVPQRRQGNLLIQFGRRRLQDFTLSPDDETAFQRYREVLDAKNMIDFDDIIALTGRLLQESPDVADRIAASWDHLLVDEFQDLDQTQFDIVCRLAQDHRSIFAVGDDEQSIFSWRGAEPEVLVDFRRRFSVDEPVVLDENRRCSRQIFHAARRLIAQNPTLFDKEIVATRDSEFEVAAWSFPDDDREAAWLLEDLQADKTRHGGKWGDRAVLYRQHRVGEVLEKLFLRAGIPCRMPRGRAMMDDDVIAYVVASLRVIRRPGDMIAVEAFADRLLPRYLVEQVRSRYVVEDEDFLKGMRAFAKAHARDDPDTKKAWRFIFHVENLAALGQAHHSLPQLVDELLSQNVGKYRNPLEDRYDELTDPAEDPAVVELADRLRSATSDGRRIWVAPANGLQFALRRLMLGADLKCPVRYLTDDSNADTDDLVIDAAQAGITLRLFKALQLVSSTQYGESYPRFVCFDLETTDKDPATCGIVEIGAVRVERGRVVDRFRALVNPGMPVAAQATEVHGYTEADLADQPSLREVWPGFREFVGSDLLIAHNAHGFDVPVLRQAAAGCPGIDDLTFYDTLPLARSLFSESAKLTDLAARFEVSLPRAHHALDDAEALAEVVGHLHRVKADRARRSALVSLLDYVALGLALEGVDHTGEAATVLDIARPAALGRFSDALESYSAEREAWFKDNAPSVEEIIERLGGWQLMNRIRASRTARERYPSAMGRLLSLLESIEGDTLIEAIDRMLERVALSTSEGIEVDPNRVSLLTLHSTKGLEFSRVYIVGVEDYQIPGYYAMEEKRQDEIQESRRLLYVGMTRARDRLVLTRVAHRAGKPAGGGMFLAEMRLEAVAGGR